MLSFHIKNTKVNLTAQNHKVSYNNNNNNQMHFPEKLCSCPRLPWIQLQTSGVKQKDANLSKKNSQQLSYFKRTSNKRQVHFQIPKSRLAEAWHAVASCLHLVLHQNFRENLTFVCSAYSVCKSNTAFTDPSKDGYSDFIRIPQNPPPHPKISMLGRIIYQASNFWLERLKCDGVIRMWRKRRNGVKVEAFMQFH